MADRKSDRLRGPRQDLTGKCFGRLTPLRWQYKKNSAGRNKIWWLCQCACGCKKEVFTAHLVNGPTVSCGCYHREVVASGKGHTTHGRTGTPEHRAWLKAKERCFNTNTKNYTDYGGRGLIMCNGWRNNFKIFFADIRKKPTSNHTIDRINNEIGYTCGKCDQCIKNGWPLNCRWATRTEQGNNKRNNRRATFRGETKTLTEFAREYGLEHWIVIHRIDRGSTLEEALTRPIIRRKKRKPEPSV